MRNPGSAGLTADRLGDADKWAPDGKERKDSTRSVASNLAAGIVAETK